MIISTISLDPGGADIIIGSEFDSISGSRSAQAIISDQGGSGSSSTTLPINSLLCYLCRQQKVKRNSTGSEIRIDLSSIPSAVWIFFCAYSVRSD
jgi:hypothetical protein